MEKKKKKPVYPFFAPIQIASDLDKLILHPETCENKSKVEHRLSNESIEPSIKHVVSSASIEILRCISISARI